MPDAPTLLLIGHGSTRYPGAGDLLRRTASRLQADGHAATVAFLNGAPSVQDALCELAGKPVQVIPCFMEDGYFTKVAIPRALQGAQVQLSRPIGVHPAMPGLIRDQAMTCCRQQSVQPRQAALLVVGHGSASAPGRPLALYDHVGQIAAGNDFACTAAACLEEAPYVADVLGTLREYPVIVLGYFANLGGHMLDDVPRLLRAEQTARGARGPEIHFAGSVMNHPAIADLIIEQSAGSLQGE